MYKWCEYIRNKDKLLSEKLYSNICRVLLKLISEKYKGNYNVYVYIYIMSF